MLSSQPIGFGIVGCGEASELQANALRLVEGAKISAFCDVSRPRAEARAEQFGGKVHTRVQDLADDPAVNVVSICTPFGLHMEAAVTAAVAGKHVLIEEPLEVTLERLDLVVAACREHRVKLGAMLPHRFLPSSKAVKQAIIDGRFGRLARASVFIKWSGRPAPYSASSWLEGGGVLMNQGFHGVDLLQWLMGPVSRVSAFPNRRARGGRSEEVLGMTLQFRSGAVGLIESSKGAWPGEDLRVEVRGNRGAVILRNDRIAYWEFEDGTMQEPLCVPALAEGWKIATDAEPPEGNVGEGQRRQLEDFIGAVKDNRRPGVEGTEARPVVAIIQAAYRSAREGRVVEVHEA